VAEIEIRQAPQNGQVVLVLTGAPQDERRFRLKDTLTNKYLTKRGWSGKPAYLPGDAVAKDKVLELALEEDLARKITPFATLILEAPSAAFSMKFVWRPKVTEVAKTEFVLEDVPDLTPNNDEVSDEIEPEVEKPDEMLLSEPGKADAEDAHPVLEEKQDKQLFGSAPSRRNAFHPILLAAVFLLFGIGAGYALFANGTSSENSDTQLLAAQDAKKDLETELNKANEKVATLGKELERTRTRAQLPPDQRSAELSRQLDAMQKSLVKREAEIEALKQAQPQQTADTSADSDWQERVRRAEEERDLYSQELQALTTNFAQLQKEKTALKSAQTAGANNGRAIWGAAAIDEGGTIYALQNQTVEKAAKDNVNAVCQGKSSFRCVPLSSYKNACLSVARFVGEQPSAQNYGFAVHSDWKQAEENALDQCRQRGGDCEIRFTACSPDTLSKPVSE
jgi:hypothetical protein